MKRVLVAVFLFMLTLSSIPLAGAKIEPYLYNPTVPDTAFSVIALYETGNHAEVLEGCEWLMAIRTPFDSWGYKYGEEHEAKYTAMAMMALMRGERIARGRYNATLNSAAYWLIYKQKPDGSWEDYTGTALSLIALKEFLEGGYLDEKLPGFREQVEEAIERAQGWLMDKEPKTKAEGIFGYMALGKKKELKEMEAEGELKAYRAFALAYLGEKVTLSGEFNSTVAVAMALYATRDEKYLQELLRRQHFGFWGTLHYRALDLVSVSKIRGFNGLQHEACPYISKITPTTEWEKVILADYYLTCNLTPKLPSNISDLLPWQVAELARVKAALGKDYSREVSYLLSMGKNGVWKDFYNTEYVVWVLKTLNVSYDYELSLRYLSENLTWMLTTADPRTGNPVYYNTPTYYFAYAVIVFKEFGMENELNETLEVLKERQYPNGAFPYTQGSVAGITSTAKAVWALQEAGLTESQMYEKGVQFLRDLLYAEIPKPEVSGDAVKLANATFILVKDALYIGNSTDSAEVGGLDGYVVIYPSQHPLSITAKKVSGFKAVAMEHGKSTNYTYVAVAVVLILIAVAVWKKR
ncbi:membrane protein [Thermococcus eurythermalis]|uniref:Membrane protein n=1 Tax=Thermococcus eurythermalis TaxID=1505907 RepID=A0A097QT64_9EURY|nr:hypothetical protein [Thermococcus eurythermalis]AIU69667.1 membrane protein [Thermococcus eurythermalis]